MISFTDFIVRVGSEEIEFRHQAKSVRDFLLQEDEIIYDIFETQTLKKKEVISVRLSPAPYAFGYMCKFRRSHSDLTELWTWVYSLTHQQREDILERYYN